MVSHWASMMPDQQTPSISTIARSSRSNSRTIASALRRMILESNPPQLCPENGPYQGPSSQLPGQAFSLLEHSSLEAPTVASPQSHRAP